MERSQTWRSAGSSVVTSAAAVGGVSKVAGRTGSELAAADPSLQTAGVAAAAAAAAAAQALEWNSGRQSCRCWICD